MLPPYAHLLKFCRGMSYRNFPTESEILALYTECFVMKEYLGASWRGSSASFVAGDTRMQIWHAILAVYAAGKLN